MRRIPRIKFPQRHPKPSGREMLDRSPLLSFYRSASDSQASSSANDANLAFFSRSKASTTSGGKASDQPKRTPLSNNEIEAILLGACL